VWETWAEGLFVCYGDAVGNEGWPRDTVDIGHSERQQRGFKSVYSDCNVGCEHGFDMHQWAGMMRRMEWGRDNGARILLGSGSISVF